MKQINEPEFWKWFDDHPQTSSYMREELKAKYGDALSQRIREFNWQLAQMEKIQNKLVNLIKDPMGKMILAYQNDTDADVKGIIDELKEAKQ